MRFFGAVRGRATRSTCSRGSPTDLDDRARTPQDPATTDRFRLGICSGETIGYASHYIGTLNLEGGTPL